MKMNTLIGIFDIFFTTVRWLSSILFSFYTIFASTFTSTISSSISFIIISTSTSTSASALILKFIYDKIIFNYPLTLLFSLYLVSSPSKHYF